MCARCDVGPRGGCVQVGMGGEYQGGWVGGVPGGYTSYQGTCIWTVYGPARPSACPWLSLTGLPGWPGLLRQMSHRTATRGPPDPVLYVTRNMNEAVPRSHLTHCEPAKVSKLSPAGQYLRGLDSRPALSGARMVNQQGTRPVS